MQLNTTHDPVKISISAAAAGSNDTAVNYIALKLVFSTELSM